MEGPPSRPGRDARRAAERAALQPVPDGETVQERGEVAARERVARAHRVDARHLPGRDTDGAVLIEGPGTPGAVLDDDLAHTDREQVGRTPLGGPSSRPR